MQGEHHHEPRTAQRSHRRGVVPDVCADSLDTVELSMAIEDKLGVSMPDGLMATMLTIGDLLKYLQENK